MTRRNITWGLAGLCLLVVAGVGGRMIYKHVRWKRFAIVEPGRVYRSGQLETHQLASAIEKLKLKTVICLNDERAKEERALCKTRGVTFHYFEMPSDGLGKPEQFAEVARILNNPSAQPVLIHCSAGVARTGAAIAMHRMSTCDWKFSEAIDELRSFEKNGYCDPKLQHHIYEVYHESILPQVAEIPDCEMFR